MLCKHGVNACSKKSFLLIPGGGPLGGGPRGTDDVGDGAPLLCGIPVHQNRVAVVNSSCSQFQHWYTNSSMHHNYSALHTCTRVQPAHAQLKMRMLILLSLCTSKHCDTLFQGSIDFVLLKSSQYVIRRERLPGGGPLGGGPLGGGPLGASPGEMSS
jgi:hypothetical protein